MAPNWLLLAKCATHQTKTVKQMSQSWATHGQSWQCVGHFCSNSAADEGASPNDFLTGVLLELVRSLLRIALPAALERRIMDPT